SVLFNDTYCLDLKQSRWHRLAIPAAESPSPRYGHSLCQGD
ncbi:hypothetical protein KIPB_016297, partial [Kipferlia bialata]